jgi:hypothetical protein
MLAIVIRQICADPVIFLNMRLVKQFLVVYPDFQAQCCRSVCWRNAATKSNSAHVSP